MACCGTASIWAKLALVAIVISLVLDIVGVATIAWMVYQSTTNSVRVGLFRMKSCVALACTESEINTAVKSENFYATQGLEILTCVLIALGAVAIIVYVFLPGARGKCLAITAIAMCLTASFCGLIGMICWLVYISSPYVVSYSLGLTVLASILACIAGLLLFPDVLDDSYHIGGRGRIQSTPNRRLISN